MTNAARKPTSKERLYYVAWLDQATELQGHTSLALDLETAQGWCKAMAARWPGHTYQPAPVSYFEEAR